MTIGGPVGPVPPTTSMRAMARSVRGLPAGLVLLAATAVSVGAQQQAEEPARVFTAEQAERGRALYEEICIECHLASLAGANEAPPLLGADFLDAWGAGGAVDLADTIRVTMPPENRNSLTPQQSYDLAAFVLQQNGAAAGDDSLAVGNPGPGASLEVVTPPGEREIQDFEPVTTEMLLDPAPGDWLMFRRTTTARATAPSSRSTPATSVNCGWPGPGRWRTA